MNPKELQDAGSNFQAWLVIWLRLVIRRQRRLKFINDHLKEGLCFIREIAKGSFEEDGIPPADEMEDFVEIGTPDIAEKWRKIEAAARKFRSTLYLPGDVFAARAMISS
jgi:hypothetical protein